MACTLLRGVCRGLRQEFRKGGKGSDHGYNRVSTHAGITITIVYSKRMTVIFFYCSQVLHAS